MKRKTRKKIERAFYCYYENKTLETDYVLNCAEFGLIPNYGKPAVKSSVSGGREESICRAIDIHELAYRWARVVENTLIKYHGTVQERLICGRYFARKEITRLTVELGISERTLYRWLDEIRETAYLWAVELKIIGDDE